MPADYELVVVGGGAAGLGAARAAAAAEARTLFRSEGIGVRTGAAAERVAADAS